MEEERQAFTLGSVLRPSQGSEEHCFRQLERIRWPDVVRCIRCSQTGVRRVSAATRSGHDHPLYWCPICRYQFRITTGTIFHDSHVPLSKWFLALRLICSAKHRISIKWLQQELAVTYKTAWRIAHHIGTARQQNSGFYQRLFSEIGQAPANRSESDTQQGSGD
jgi:transposase-like protein